jgi:hypothetical protein
MFGYEYSTNILMSKNWENIKKPYSGGFMPRDNDLCELYQVTPNMLKWMKAVEDELEDIRNAGKVGFGF